MPFKKGEVANPAGRPVGAANKSTRLAKEVVAEFIHTTSGDIPALWLRVCEDNPAEAIKIWAKLAEFVMPALQRVQHSGVEDEPPIIIEVKSNL